MAQDVQLNFINNSNDLTNSDVVIFQKDIIDYYPELPIAWQVIKYCGPGDNHPFTFPLGYSVRASDSYGNYTPQLPAQNGQLFVMQFTTSGDRLLHRGDGTNSAQIQVLNLLPKGKINADIYKNGKLLAVRKGIAPQGKAVFELIPTIWIGVVSQVVQGAEMNSAILSTINTKFSLLGIASADIVMTGGGTSSKGFEFNLENVVYA